MNIYETDKLLAEYLLFHYGTEDEVRGSSVGSVLGPSRPGSSRGAETARPEESNYPARCVSECVDLARLPANARALDLGCAVGRSTFELARHCAAVIGIDFSRRFIEAADELTAQGELPYLRADEGALTTPCRALVAPEIDRKRVHFEVGDAMHLRSDLGIFEVVLMANLIDRLSEPQRCLSRLAGLVKPGGQLIITSPYTWLEDFTPRAHWLGGFARDGERVTTRHGLTAALAADFALTATRDLPFLIREHARKYQWSVAEATIWQRR